MICTYTAKRWDLFEAAVDEVRHQLEDGDELVVVVDHNDELVQRCELRWPDQLVVPNQFARGLSGARNSGVAAASCPVVIFLDDDAVPQPKWLAAFRHRFAEPGVVGVGGAITPAWEGGHAPAWFPEEFGWVVGCDYAGMPGDGEEIRNPIGASMGVRREELLEVGGFAEVVGRIGDKPVGCEETDLFIRLRQAEPSSRVLRETGAVVDHSVPQQRQTLRYFVRRCWHEGRSKAVLTSRVGSGDGLSAERKHLLFMARRIAVLLAGSPRRPARAAQAALLVIGSGATALGFLSARGTASVSDHEPDGDGPAAVAGGAQPEGWVPMRIDDVDLDDPATTLSVDDAMRVQMLAFTGGVPRGIVTVPPGEHDRADLLALAQAAGLPVAQAPAPTPADRPTAAVLPTVSIVVPTAGRAEQLSRCVDSLVAQDYPHLEVVIVDNNADSSDSRRVLAEHLAAGRIRLVHEPDGGSSEARNAGLAAATGEIIAQTDDDVIAHPRWVSALVEQFDAPDVALVTGLVVPTGHDTRAQELFEEYGGFGKGFAARTFDLDRHRGDGLLYPFTTGSLGSGNNVAYRTEVVRALGGYDPLLGPGSVVRAGQDLDLFLRVLFSGATIRYTPAAVVRHEHRRTMPELERQILNYGRGLAAVMLKAALDNPRTALQIAVRLPLAAVYLLSPRSGKNRARSTEYPTSMKRAELKGLGQGTLTYLRARWRR
ncbi:MAG: glycosyltransferase family 2 protein [Kineosporiaceae bacterium]